MEPAEAEPVFPVPPDPAPALPEFAGPPGYAFPGGPDAVWLDPA